MDLQSMTDAELKAEEQRLYDKEAALARQRKAVSHERALRLNAARVKAEVERTMATLSPDALSALIKGASGHADAEGQAN